MPVLCILVLSSKKDEAIMGGRGEDSICRVLGTTGLSGRKLLDSVAGC